MKRLPRIVFMNRSYWPDTEATGQLLTSLCEGLADRYDVHVVAGQPNVASGSTSGSDWRSISVRNGVTIHRVEHTRWNKSNLFLRGLNFVSFTAAAHRAARRIANPDAVVFETDPFLLPFVADSVRRRTGCQMIGYLQDIYPDVAVALGKVSNNWLIRGLRRRLFSIYRRCDQMVVLSRDMAALLRAGGVDPARTRTIANWADTDLIRPVNGANLFRDKYSLDGKFVVMYSGNLGLTQRLEDFIHAAELLRDDSDVQFVFIGGGANRPKLEQMVADKRLGNVMFCEYQPMSELAHSLGAADLHLIPLTRELSQCLMPSKLYGVLAAGRPYLTNAPAASELHQLTCDEDIGVTVPAGSPTAIAERIRELKQSPQRCRRLGQNARRLAVEQCRQEQAIERFAGMLDGLLRKQPGSVAPEHEELVVVEPVRAEPAEREAVATAAQQI